MIRWSPAGLVLAVSAWTACAAAAEAPAPSLAPALPNAVAMGSSEAPVTVVEYASVGCPHCAVWANGVFPEFKKKYIDTGKVRFVFHEVLTGNPTLAAAGFLTARCAAPDKYFQVVDDIFAKEDEIGRDGVEALVRIADSAGVKRDQFMTCLRDNTALAALSERTAKDAQAHGVTGTPTFFVGDKKLEGEQPLDALDTAIAQAKR